MAVDLLSERVLTDLIDRLKKGAADVGSVPSTALGSIHLSDADNGTLSNARQLLQDASMAIEVLLSAAKEKYDIRP